MGYTADGDYRDTLCLVSALGAGPSWACVAF